MADKFITVNAIMLLFYCNHIWNTTNNNNNNNSIQLNNASVWTSAFILVLQGIQMLRKTYVMFYTRLAVMFIYE